VFWDQGSASVGYGFVQAEIPFKEVHLFVREAEDEQEIVACTRADKVYLSTKETLTLVVLPKELLVFMAHVHDIIVVGVLESLPDWLGELDRLEVLRVGPNSQNMPLQTLPESFGSLVRLKILCLNSCNSLKILPLSLGNLTGLQHLELCDAGITSLPESIGSLTLLRRLKLISNELQTRVSE